MLADHNGLAEQVGIRYSSTCLMQTHVLTIGLGGGFTSLIATSANQISLLARNRFAIVRPAHVSTSLMNTRVVGGGGSGVAGFSGSTSSSVGAALGEGIG